MDAMRESFECSGAGGNWKYEIDAGDPAVKYEWMIWKAAWKFATEAECEACAKCCEVPAGTPAHDILGGEEGILLCNGLAEAIRNRATLE